MAIVPPVTQLTFTTCAFQFGLINDAMGDHNIVSSFHCPSGSLWTTTTLRGEVAWIRTETSISDMGRAHTHTHREREERERVRETRKERGANDSIRRRCARDYQQPIFGVPKLHFKRHSKPNYTWCHISSSCSQGTIGASFQLKRVCKLADLRP